VRQRAPAAPATAAGDRHLVLVGIDFVPRRATGDKNFWAALLPELARGIDRISIVSVRDAPEPRERVRIGACEIDIRYIPPALPRSGGPTSIGRRLLGWQGGSHPRIEGLIGKQLVTRRIMGEIRDVLEGTTDVQVHLMDNFGPANHLLAWLVRRHGARMSVTAIAYERRGRRTYDWFLRISYRVPGVRVIALSRTFERRLRVLGVRRAMVSRIPWGVHPQTSVAAKERADGSAAARARLGIPLDLPAVLWAGFIQQIREPDFHLAYDVASRAREGGLEASFVFAFKPETFRPEYAALDRPASGIRVLPTPIEVFADARAAADVLFSPIEARDCIVAPPLTWIECMATGIPVVSTDVPGADELIEDGRTGYRAGDRADLAVKLQVACERFIEMGEACRGKVAAEYDLVDIGRAYRRLWFGTG
jgi:glycosyltransferase involved in cell wall biosynthesis